MKEEGEPQDLEQDLAVFASATLVRQNDVELRDVPGAPIDESRSDAYFHIARRGDHASAGWTASGPVMSWYRT